jgi:hypothetical protein
VHPFTFRSTLGRERDVVEYQVCQTARGADVRVRCQNAVDTARIAAALRAALLELGLAGAEVSVTAVETLERQTPASSAGRCRCPAVERSGSLRRADRGAGRARGHPRRK